MWCAATCVSPTTPGKHLRSLGAGAVSALLGLGPGPHVSFQIHFHLSVPGTPLDSPSSPEGIAACPGSARRGPSLEGRCQGRTPAPSAAEVLALLGSVPGPRVGCCVSTARCQGPARQLRVPGSAASIPGAGLVPPFSPVRVYLLVPLFLVSWCRAREALRQCLPDQLKDTTFAQVLKDDTTTKRWLAQLVKNLQEGQVTDPRGIPLPPQ